MKAPMLVLAVKVGRRDVLQNLLTEQNSKGT